MTCLVCIGLGYSAEAFIRRHGDGNAPIIGTNRTASGPAMIAGRALERIVLDGPVPPALATRLADADLIVSAPPASVATAIGSNLSETHARPRAIVYLSSVAVYGDAGGQWIDEDSPLKTTSDRGVARIDAERAWQDLAATHGVPLTILRLAGIYGPGNNALVNLVRGTARRIVKKDQVFNRIHVDDIADASALAFRLRAKGVYNLADDEPAPPQDVVAYAARKLGVPVPPDMPFEEARATMSPMAVAFYAENKRIANAKIKRELGFRFSYPNYRIAIDALAAAGDHNGAAR